MPETVDLTKYLVNGLRPSSRVDKRNTPFLTKSKNRIPTEGGLKDLAVASYPIGSPALAMTWPHMQLMRAGRKLLLFTATGVYNVTESGWTASAITTYNAASPGSAKAIAAGTGVWQVAGFEDMWFATKGNTMAYFVPSTPAKKSLS